MPVDKHMLITMTGRYGTAAAPVEFWSWSIKVTHAGLNSKTAELQPVADAVSAAYGTHLVSLFKSDVVLTRARVANVVLTNGRNHVEKDGVGQFVQADALTERPGSATNATVMPLQTALAVSLVSDRAGPSGRGRFWLPWPAMNLGTDYRLSTASADAVLNSVRGWTRAVSAIPYRTGTIGPLLILSSKGFTSGVTQLRVGRAPDTMRSRRSDVLEGYSTLPA